MSLEYAVKHYGYMTVLVRAFIEGETVLVIGGFLGHSGYLKLPSVILVAFLGTCGDDQIFFNFGSVKGTKVIDRRKVWKRKPKRVMALLRAHPVLVVVGFRFLYGLRSVMPFMTGLSRMNPIRFLLFNGVGILLWAISVGFLGYGSGILMEAVLGEVKKYELLIPALIDATGAGVWLVYLGIQARAIRHDTRLWRI